MSLTNKEHVEQILAELKNGSILTQRTHDGEKNTHHFFLHLQEQFISYYREVKKSNPPPRYFIHKIDEIRVGFNTRTFDRLVRHQSIDQNDEKCAFSIFSNNYRDELHLIASDQHTRDMWVEGLQYLVQTDVDKRQRHVINETNWITNYFYLADKDGSNTLTKKECRQLLLDSLNAKVSDQDFNQFFKEADQSGEGVLTSDEFIQFFRLLIRRRDLYKIMQTYVQNGEKQSMDTIRMNVDELLYFLQNIQKQKIIKPASKDSKLNFSLEIISKREDVEELINEFELNDELRQKGQLSLDSFRNLLLWEDFSLIKPWCSRYIYQDMTRPLSDYYIKTSHNTYLFNTQLTGDSNPEAYNRVLSKGCRAVEIDCYDGNNGRPIVKHGFTLVRPCLFESIIRFIERNLFKTSPYPVILDIENHCSIEQQYEMARILQNILGDRLVSEPILRENSAVLPSPEDLKYKVLIRGVKLPSPTTIPSLMRVHSVEDQSKPRTYGLADLVVYLQNVPFREYTDAKDNSTCYDSANIAEKLFDRAAKTDPTGLIKQTLKSSLRMYPDGLRQDSSNPNPIYPWNFGVQMVALNYQYDDSMMSLSYGKFLDNGGCGYVLKPNYLIDIDKSYFNPLHYMGKPLALPESIAEQPQCLTITIISGQFLPRSSETTQDIPDPYVIISTHGVACDEQSYRTKTIQNNGFDPQWNETFRFEIYFSQLCLLRFNIYDENRFAKDDRIAYFCLPFTTIQTGYRHVPLKARNNSLTYSTLFVHVEIKNI